MTQEAIVLEAPEPYRARILPAPVAEADCEAVLELLEHKGEPWLADIEARLRGKGGRELFAVAELEGVPVAHAWLGRSADCRELGWIGHVFTAEDHRRRGLATVLLKGLLAEFDERGGWLAVLGTGNEAAAALYRRLGFAAVNGEEGRGTVIMARGVRDAGELKREYPRASGEWEVERYGREVYPAVCTLLAAWPEGDKLPVLEIGSGTEAEEKLLHALLRHEKGTHFCTVLLDAENGRPHGMACLKGSTLEVFAPGVEDEAERHFIELSLWLGSRVGEED